MAFENPERQHAGVQRSLTLLHQVRQLYSIGKVIQSLIIDYQAGNDPALVAALNALYTSAERQELAQMVGQVNTLVTNWESAHRAALGLPPLP